VYSDSLPHILLHDKTISLIVNLYVIRKTDIELQAAETELGFFSNQFQSFTCQSQ